MTTFLGPQGAEAYLHALTLQDRDVRVVRAGHDKRSVLAGFASALDLPEWFGHNWDALVDALRDLDGDGSRRIELVWDHVHALRRADPQAYATVVEILGHVEDQRDDLGVTIIDR